MGALTLIGGVLSAVAAISAGRAQANAAEFNADMAQQQAVRETQIADREAKDYRRQQSRLKATSRARRAGSGVTYQGSHLLVYEAMAAEIELGAQDILAGGAAKAYGYQQDAALSRARASSVRTSSYLNAGGTLLTTAGQTSDSGFFAGP